jgi:hypothetical protein
MRLVFAFLAVAAASPAFAQHCMTMPGMAVCDDGRMMMNGVWMTPPPIPDLTIQSQIGPGQASSWSMREFVNPDGSRVQHWERKVIAPDGTAQKEEQNRVVLPDGRVCLQDGPTLKCP